MAGVREQGLESVIDRLPGHSLPRGGKMDHEQKRLKQNYKQTSRAMGIFLIRNNLNDRVLLGSSLDLNGIINRHKFQLSKGGHPNQALQADWDEFGEHNFAFEIVDELTPHHGIEFDYREEIKALENLWLEKLQPFGERGYNVPTISRAERLRRIAERSRNQL